MYTYISEILVYSRAYLLVHAPFAHTPRQSTGEGRPVNVVEVWARSVQCVARGMQCGQIFDSAGVDNTIPGFLRCESYLCLLFFEKLGFFTDTNLCENTEAGHNSGFPVQIGRGYSIIQFSGRTACRVSRVHVPCVMRCFFL